MTNINTKKLSKELDFIHPYVEFNNGSTYYLLDSEEYRKYNHGDKVTTFDITTGKMVKGVFKIAENLYECFEYPDLLKHIWKTNTEFREYFIRQREYINNTDIKWIRILDTDNKILFAIGERIPKQIIINH